MKQKLSREWASLVFAIIVSVTGVVLAQSTVIDDVDARESTVFETSVPASAPIAVSRPIVEPRSLP